MKRITFFKHTFEETEVREVNLERKARWSSSEAAFSTLYC